MQIRNNYTKEVYNGDIGVVRAVDQEEGQVAVAYPGEMGPKVVVYEREELDELVLAYATTVHKSQGSEYPVVVMPVSTQHYMMLQRHLLYTAVTRARKLVILVGTKKALAIAVRNNRLEDRFSRLADRLRGR
jgi:exodeoxyribonuclease V alpha subunit